jgi:hypothetical protein
MAHPSESTEAVVAPVHDVDSAAAAFRSMMPADEGEAREEEDKETQAPAVVEGDDPEIELDAPEEEDGKSGEPETAIDAPASLNAEEKALFAQLPEEAQRAWAASETRRNTQVQTATTKAAEAQRLADERAATADAQAKKVYATQLMSFVQGLAPAAPSPQLAIADPGRYIAEKAQYDADLAQLNTFAQQVMALDTEADTQLDKTFIESRDRALYAIPEVQNEATRSEFFGKAVEAAKALNLDTPALNRATADEWQKLRQVHDWKTKADKYDAAMSRQMQRVREGKPSSSKTMRPGAAQPVGSAPNKAFGDATQRLKSSGSIDDAAAAFKHFI